MAAAVPAAMVAPADGDGDGAAAAAAAAAAAQGRGPGQAAATTTYPVKRFVYVIANITALSGLLFGWVGACARAFLESGVWGVCGVSPASQHIQNRGRWSARLSPIHLYTPTPTHTHTPRAIVYVIKSKLPPPPPLTMQSHSHHHHHPQNKINPATILAARAGPSRWR